MTALGTGCAAVAGPAEVPRIGMSHEAALGTTCSLNLSRVPPGVPAVLVLGRSSTTWGPLTLPVELGAVGAPGCFLRVSPDTCLVRTTRGVHDKGWIAKP
ncbi:MAG: hypothetical protein AAF628_23235 [Planctomycetota bacterium]